MSDSLFLALREGASVSHISEGEMVVGSDSSRITLRQPGRGAMLALKRLASGEHEDELAECVRDLDGGGALARFYHYLDRLSERGLLRRSVKDGGALLVTLEPVSCRFAFPSCKCARNRQYILSRFCYVHRELEVMVLESPLSEARVTLHDPRAAALLHALGRPRTVADLSTTMSSAAAELAADLLLNVGMLEEVDGDGTPHEEHDQVLRGWEFHDLLFHSRTRAGISDSRIGAAYNWDGLDLPPALKPMQPGETIELFRPDLDALQNQDPPFARIQEMRRSIREYAASPITFRQLGEFLYRVARVRDCKNVTVPTTSGGVPLSIATRPYPSGGALYELEFYLAINNCEDLGRGFYYYDPLHHRLCRLPSEARDVEWLLAEAAMSALIPGENVQVLLVLAARFPRIGWKYAGLTYSLILKNVGVVCQTMYLAATAMGLAPCALGCGDAGLFARAAGTNYYAETSVGEFLLGSKA